MEDGFENKKELAGEESVKKWKTQELGGDRGAANGDVCAGMTHVRDSAAHISTIY